MIDWKIIDTTKKLDEAGELSKTRPVVIYKHSTRCGICSTVKSQLERSWPENENAPPVFYVDVLLNRDISRTIAEKYGVEHESPQALLIRDGKCERTLSHFQISAGAILRDIAL